MFRYILSAATAAAFSGSVLAADAEGDRRLQTLEQRLERFENELSVKAPAPSANAFNPAIALILSGVYANLSQSPEGYRISGFALPEDSEIGPGSRGFSLGESELVISANIDPYLFGNLALVLTPEGEVELEEGFIQTIALSHGLSVKAGRLFSGIGYLNVQHPHSWDFVDAPLAYQALLGGQYGDDGVQLKWLAPTETFLEMGVEVMRGAGFPASERDKNGSGAATFFAHLGGDVGISNSWRAGLSMLSSAAQGREVSDVDLADAEVTNSFSGDSRLWIADFVWKYAPNGNAAYSNFKLQGEYLHRSESGELTYDVGGSNNTAAYDAEQSGWYLQGIYQFMPNWRVGLRGDRLDPGTVDYGANSANLAQPAFNPSKQSVMVDYRPSEFSRIRLQFTQDKSRQDLTDNQIFLQYHVSLGAHGGHQF